MLSSGFVPQAPAEIIPSSTCARRTADLLSGACQVAAE